MKTVVIDFDGTLASYDGKFEQFKLGLPMPGAYAALADYLKAGYRVVIATTRAKDAIGKQLVKDWLGTHGFNELGGPDGFQITAFKVPAVAYIDDRAWRFEGTWPSAKELDNFTPHWDKE